MGFRHPFQCIEQIPRVGGANKFLVAAAGGNIFTFDFCTGERLSCWPQIDPAEQKEPANPENEHDTVAFSQGKADEEPPGKRQKLSGREENGSNDSNKSASFRETWATIPILKVTARGTHVVAMTAEDKCIRVFMVNECGRLSQISERCMPKRPSALALTDDDSMILCADKFGDVYSLPLIHSPEKTAIQKRRKPHQPKQFQPSATNLTVHTKRNLRALEQQLKTLATALEKSGPDFERTLLLGHVSMLTDIAFVAFPDARRKYILTADRDEHIRVTRGPPQTHVIHNYCLGHTAFVNKLCIPPWDPSILISGGGDNFLLVWNWLEGEMIQKVDLRQVTSTQIPATQRLDSEIVVAGIWAVSFEGHQTLRNMASGAILVSFEGTSHIAPFVFDKSHKLIQQQVIELCGHVLALLPIDNAGGFLASIDNIHEKEPTKKLRTEASSERLLQQFLPHVKEDDTTIWSECPSSLTANVDSFNTGTPENGSLDKKAIEGLLYPAGALRKRGNEKED